MTPSSRDEPIRAAYADIAEGYDDRWTRYLDESIQTTLETLAPLPHESILDVGCGTGRLLREILNRQGTGTACGVDLSAEMLAVAARVCGPRAYLVLGDASKLGFADRAFDAVVSSSSLHHWNDPRAVFAEAARVLRPSGRLVITDWCRDIFIFKPFAAFLRLTDPTVHHIHSKRELLALLRDAGFTIRDVRTYRVARFWGMMTVAAVRGGTA